MDSRININANPTHAATVAAIISASVNWNAIASLESEDGHLGFADEIAHIAVFTSAFELDLQSGDFEFPGVFAYEVSAKLGQQFAELHDGGAYSLERAKAVLINLSKQFFSRANPDDYAKALEHIQRLEPAAPAPARRMKP